MIFTVEVTPGEHTTEADLTRVAKSVIIALQMGVDDAAHNMFPEFKFGAVAQMPEPSGKHHAPPF